MALQYTQLTFQDNYDSSEDQVIFTSWEIGKLGIICETRYDFDDSEFEEGIVDCAGITLNLEQCKQLYTFLHQHLNQHENLV